MKVICKVSHETINSETGGFRRFDAGKLYDVEDPDMEFFEQPRELKGVVAPAKKKEVKSNDYA